MKLKPEAVGTRLDKPSPDIRLYLFHGPDEAGAADLAARLARGVGADAERVDLDGPALRARPGLLADEAASMSLFGDKRHIRVAAMGEESLEAVTLLLAAERAGNPVVALAPSIKGTGKLAKLVGDAPNAIACACYVPDAQEAARIATASARDHGLRLSHDAAEYLASASNGDRAILAREIEKLALFLDADATHPRDAGMEALEAIGADLAETEMFAAIAALVDGDPAAAGAEIAAMQAAGESSIPLLRMAVRRLMTLAEMRAEVDNGSSIQQVVEQHRVFFKEKPATIRALRRWNSDHLARAITRLREAERATMASGGAGDIVAAATCLTVARASARLR